MDYLLRSLKQDWSFCCFCDGVMHILEGLPVHALTDSVRMYVIVDGRSWFQNLEHVVFVQAVAIWQGCNVCKASKHLTHFPMQLSTSNKCGCLCVGVYLEPQCIHAYLHGVYPGVTEALGA